MRTNRLKNRKEGHDQHNTPSNQPNHSTKRKIIRKLKSKEWNEYEATIKTLYDVHLTTKAEPIFSPWIASNNDTKFNKSSLENHWSFTLVDPEVWLLLFTRGFALLDWCNSNIRRSRTNVRQKRSLTSITWKESGANIKPLYHKCPEKWWKSWRNN